MRRFRAKQEPRSKHPGARNTKRQSLGISRIFGATIAHASLILLSGSGPAQCMNLASRIEEILQECRISFAYPAVQEIAFVTMQEPCITHDIGKCRGLGSSKTIISSIEWQSLMSSAWRLHSQSLFPAQSFRRWSLPTFALGISPVWQSVGNCGYWTLWHLILRKRLVHPTVRIAVCLILYLFSGHLSSWLNVLNYHLHAATFCLPRLYICNVRGPYCIRAFGGRKSRNLAINECSNGRWQSLTVASMKAQWLP